MPPIKWAYESHSKAECGHQKPLCTQTQRSIQNGADEFLLKEVCWTILKSVKAEAMHKPKANEAANGYE